MNKAHKRLNQVLSRKAGIRQKLIGQLHGIEKIRKSNLRSINRQSMEMAKRGESKIPERDELKDLAALLGVRM